MRVPLTILHVQQHERLSERQLRASILHLGACFAGPPEPSHVSLWP